MNEEDDGMEYALELTSTSDATGYFACRSRSALSLEEMIAHLQRTPFDEFMHNQALDRLLKLKGDDHKTFLGHALVEKDPIRLVLCLEAGWVESLPGLNLSEDEQEGLRAYSPLIVLKSRFSKNRNLHRQWIELFRKNIFEHNPLPKDPGLAPVYDPEFLEEKFSRTTDLGTLHRKHALRIPPSAPPLPHPSETVAKALDVLDSLGILHGQEMRHESSLSPIALMRQWQMAVSVESGRQNYRISGLQNSYGRGLTLEAARASNLMEVLERYSAFASFNNNTVLGYQTDYPLSYGSFSSLAEQGQRVLNPNTLCLEVPYEDEPLYWLQGETAWEGNPDKILIPAQIIFLFCNLDEPALFSGLGSTGLAAGNTLAQAKVSALLEIIERDAEATFPFDPSLCFRAETLDPTLGPLFELYRQCGIDLIFQDLTSPRFGIPCCKCFVKGRDGEIAKGVGAHLSAKRALVSALTETPYPFPKGPPSLPGPGPLIRVPVENLPDYTTGHPETDLAILEDVLSMNGLQPIYVNLTRKDTNIPVVRAVVPGLEIMADFDDISRVSPGLFYNYLKLSKALD